MKQRRVWGYVRVSRTDLVQENQIQAIKEWADKQNDVLLVDIVTDEGMSGAAPLEERPGWQLIQRKVQAGLVDAVVVVAIDRITRAGAGTLFSAIEDMKRRGVAVISLREQIDTSTAIGEMMVALLASVARMERDNIIARTHQGIARAKAQGVRIGRPPKDISRSACTSMLASGFGIRRIARELKVSPPLLRKRLREWGLYVEEPEPANFGKKKVDEIKVADHD